ncbi:MAG: hypothetical protein CO128_07605 [Ignavibacteriales bacterium CG_4_9_14_3_um_filter_30_11]|nr:MAG: hypothetical protein CO128_07605 [Ignavibacteriales bacterium CG_4_9_14_3_um_filter_30_11]
MVSLIFFSTFNLYSQSGNTQIIIIDSFIPPEQPLTLNLSFFTNDPTSSKILISNEFEYTTTKELTSQHNIKIDISSIAVDEMVLHAFIIVTDSMNRITKSEELLIDYPKTIKVEKESNFLLFGLMFASVFIIPTPGYAYTEGESRFNLTKEIPLISFTSENINFPKSYFALELTHIYKADRSNFMRIGYRYMKEIPILKYYSPGVDLVTNFDGFNGIGASISLGLFDVLDTFTLYTRYRYNFQPSQSDRNFSEINVGLYTNFFSVHF